VIRHFPMDSDSAPAGAIDAEGTPIGSSNQEVSLPNSFGDASALNFPVRMCPPNVTFLRISQPFAGTAVKPPGLLKKRSRVVAS